MCSSLRKKISLHLSVLYLPVVLCVVLEPQGFSLFAFGMSIGVLVQLMFSHLHWWGLRDLIIWYLEETQLDNRLLDPLALPIFLVPLLQCLLSFKWWESSVDASLGTRLHNSAFWLNVLLCNGLHLLKN